MLKTNYNKVTVIRVIFDKISVIESSKETTISYSKLNPLFTVYRNIQERLLVNESTVSDKKFQVNILFTPIFIIQPCLYQYVNRQYTYNI